jgi:N-acetylmuramoyl-L-alanine amidase
MANRARIVLEKITHAEAQGEPDYGQAAVAEVILNRCKSPRFPRGIYNVVFQNAINSQGVLTHQFTPIANGAYARAVPSESVRNAVTKALEGSDFAKGAVFFHAISSVIGSWHEQNLQHVTDIGNHRFFS